jgi:hypothetical protein
MSGKHSRKSRNPRKRDVVAGTLVLLVLGGVLMSRGGGPAPILAEDALTGDVTATGVKNQHPVSSKIESDPEIRGDNSRSRIENSPVRQRQDR